VTASPTRRIWHAEVEDLCERLESAGAWQTALRVRIAHGQALARRPEGSAFDYRATVEDVTALEAALHALRVRPHAS
jgi:hypothetical protein